MACISQYRRTVSTFNQPAQYYSAQVDIPVPQAVEEVVHIPVTQTQARLRLSSCSCSFELWSHRRVLRHTKLLEYSLRGHHHQHVEQTVEVPVPMMQEEVVHVPKVRKKFVDLGFWHVKVGGFVFLQKEIHQSWRGHALNIFQNETSSWALNPCGKKWLPVWILHVVPRPMVQTM